MTLETFLKEKRALVKFRVNYRLHGVSGRKIKAEAEEFILDYAVAPNGIRGAFNWDRSPEGVYYWSQLNYEWVAICNNK